VFGFGQLGALGLNARRYRRFQAAFAANLERAVSF
jgi:hypothetical protein